MNDPLAEALRRCAVADSSILSSPRANSLAQEEAMRLQESRHADTSLFVKLAIQIVELGNQI